MLLLPTPRNVAVLLSTLLFLLPAPVLAQWVSDGAAIEPPPQSVAEILDQFARPDAPGAAVAVLLNGELTYTGVFGMASLEQEVAVTPETVFGVASLAKQFTAFAIAMLANDGALSLDDDIRLYLPEVPDFGETITIRHLIHHTSGLRDEKGMLALAGWRSYDLITTEDVLRMVSRLTALDQTPGDGHLYSNTNYTLLAEIVARVSNQSFTSWTSANLFEPLGMTDSRFVNSPESSVPNRATNYAPSEPNGFARKPDAWYNVGPGGLTTTVLDLAKWAQNLMSGRVGGDAVLRQVREAGRLNDGTQIEYAYGLGLSEHGGLMTIGHGGATPGTQSDFRVYPEQGFAVIVLSNAGDNLIPTYDLARQLATFYLGEQMRLNAPAPSGGRRAVMITEDDLEATPVGSYDADPAQYDAYEGTYTTGSGDLLDRIIVTHDGDRLLVAFREPPGIPVAPTGEHRFQLAQLGFDLTFHMNQAGEVASLSLYIPERGDEPSQTLTGIKQDRHDLATEELQAYTGTYYSAELETLYRVVTEGDHLVIQHQRHGSIPLVHLAADAFLADTQIFTSVTFLRDEEGQVAKVQLTGYSWSSGAVLERITLP